MKINDNEKIICELCEKTIERNGTTNGICFEVNPPTDYIITNKITCLDCGTEYTQKEPDTKTPCNKCKSTNFKVTPNYKNVFEVGDGKQIELCFKCAQKVVEAISHQVNERPDFVSAMYEILDNYKMRFFSSKNKNKSLAQRQTEALEQILTIVKQKELITK